MNRYDEQILRAARELIARHGTNAIAHARDWVDYVTGQRDRRDVDVAYRVLTAVEELISEKAPRAKRRPARSISSSPCEAAGH